MKKIIKVLLLTIFALIGLSMLSNVKAASATIKASKNPATVGDSVTITVSANAATWNLKVSGAVSDSIIGFDQNGNNVTTTKTYKLDTSSTGSKTIVLSGDVSDGNTMKTSKINTSVSVVVNEKKAQTNPPAPTQTPAPTQPTTPSNNSGNNNSSTPAKSSDTKLKSVTVNGNSYKIGTPLTVGSEVSSVEIKATPNSSKASITGTGTKELMTGTNNFTLKVTAENGDTKKYTITVIREEFVEDTPNIEEPNQTTTLENLRLSSLVVQGVELIPEFNSEVFEYTAYMLNENELKVDATSNMEGTNVEIIGNTNLIEGENTITIKLTKEDKSVEYKIKVNKSIVQEVQNEEKSKKVGFIGSIKDWWNNGGSNVIVLTIILILFGAASIFAITSYKYSNSVKELSKYGKSDYLQNENLLNQQQK